MGALLRHLGTDPGVDRLGTTPRAAWIAWLGLPLSPLPGVLGLWILIGGGEWTPPVARGESVLIAVALLVAFPFVAWMCWRLTQLGVYRTDESLLISRLAVREYRWDEIEAASIKRSVRDPTMVEIRLDNGETAAIHTSLFANQVLPGGSVSKSELIVEVINGIVAATGST